MKLKLLFLFFLAFGLAGWIAAFNKPDKQDHLSSFMTYNYVKSVVWYHSRGKLKELEGIILNEDLSDEEAIKRKIKNMLKHRTSVYLREFNSLDAPIQNIGNHYEEMFEFTPFLNDVYEVVFSDKNVHIKLSLIADIMEAYQTKANNQLLELMSNKEARL
ncbi:hypothetical protein A6E00_13410 [Vibrio diabolicus]|uniref:Uncharacterized protein n=1 Tax=Vibrio sp. FF_273 TaxID=1652830 RepID=A0A0H3ZX79_9VIBR|nr:hypothetical protein [Vibrio diabolicus]AKN40905.1 hypothetical protein [Vibrio sp. FF_273]OCH65461.1 hypothetical protein A6E00_13410 [Vibrio diabolicus]